jgi:hypothetical protein
MSVQNRSTLKPRIVVSIVGALLIMAPVAMQRPDKIFGVLLFIVILCITIFVISSLINIKDFKMRVIFFAIVGFIFTYKFYVSYFLLHMIVPKALVVSLVFTAVFAFVFRGFSLLLEKK